MSQRVEWMDEAFVGCQVVPKGTVVGEHEVTGEVGLVFSADSITVVEGSCDRVALLLGIALDQVNQLRAPAPGIAPEWVGGPTPSGE